MPRSPATFVTNEIICVCCQERFTIAVDEPTRPPNQYGRAWYVPEDQLTSTELRYDPHREQMAVQPESRVVPFPNPNDSRHRNFTHHYFVNCPRCGADNRNMLNLHPKKLFSQRLYRWGWVLVVFILFCTAVFLSQWDQTHILRNLALVVSVFLAGALPLLLIPGSWDTARIRNHLVTVMPSLREQLSPQEMQAGITFLVFCAVLPVVFFVTLPLIGELSDRVRMVTSSPSLSKSIELVSTGLPTLSELPLAQQTAVTAAFADLVPLLNDYLRPCSSSQINNLIVDLETALVAFPQADPQQIQNAINELEEIQSQSDNACQLDMLVAVNQTLRSERDTESKASAGLCAAAWQKVSSGQELEIDAACYDWVLADTIASVNNIQTGKPIFSANSESAVLLRETQRLAATPPPGFEDDIRPTIEKLAKGFVVAEAKRPLLDWRFLAVWVFFTGLAWLAGTLCAFETMNERISWFDPHVPQPIFTSIAKMTRVAEWEANRTLEMGAFVHRIQWMRATRNEAGGIDLVGLFRDPPDITFEGIMSNQVRAQQYTISTDIWCRVRETRVIDVMTQRPAGGPAFATPVLNPIQVMISDRVRYRP